MFVLGRQLWVALSHGYPAVRYRVGEPCGALFPVGVGGSCGMFFPVGVGGSWHVFSSWGGRQLACFSQLGWEAAAAGWSLACCACFITSYNFPVEIGHASGGSWHGLSCGMGSTYT